MEKKRKKRKRKKSSSRSKRRDKRGNMEGLGQVRYTVGREYVLRAGRVLLVGMVGRTGGRRRGRNGLV